MFTNLDTELDNHLIEKFQHILIGPIKSISPTNDPSRVSGLLDNYYIDADHINLSNVGGFLNHSDFFTIDAAAYYCTPSFLYTIIESN